MPSPEEMRQDKKTALDIGLHPDAVEEVFGGRRNPDPATRIYAALDLLAQIALKLPNDDLKRVALDAQACIRNDVGNMGIERNQTVRALVGLKNKLLAPVL